MATPATALTVVVPDSVPPLGLLPSEMDTAAVDVIAGLPLRSYRVTFTGGVMVEPALTSEGCWLKTTRYGAAALMSNAELVALVSPDEEAVSL